MKKLAVLALAPLVFSCANYKEAIIVDETPVYKSRSTDEKIATIPGNTTVMMAGNGKYKKVKYKDRKGYLLNPNYATKTVVKKTKPVK